MRCKAGRHTEFAREEAPMSPVFLLATTLATCTQPLSPGEIGHPPQKGTVAYARWVMQGRYQAKVLVKEGMFIADARRILGRPTRSYGGCPVTVDEYRDWGVKVFHKQTCPIINGQHMWVDRVNAVRLCPLSELPALLFPRPGRP
jgi:hypothetical protein